LKFLFNGLRCERGARKFFIVEIQYKIVVDSDPGLFFSAAHPTKKNKTGAMAAADHALRSSGGGTEIDASRYYDFVALLVTVVVSCGVFGWCMRASRTLIRYHAGLPKMFSNSREFYDSCKPDEADTDMDSDEQDHKQKHVVGLCKSDVLVAIVVVWCGLLWWCMRARRTLIGYHASVLSTITIVERADTGTGEQEQEQEHAAEVCEFVAVECLVVLSYRVFRWCMRALRTLIGYHASALKHMTVIETEQTRVDVNSSSGNYKHDDASGVVSNSRKFYGSCKPDDADTDMDSDEQDQEQKHEAGLCKSDVLVAAIVWVVHESMAYSYWLPCQRSEYYHDC
jgi:hypothetical protein